MAQQQQQKQQEPSVKRPANTAFKQQRLKAWQPILTPKAVLPTFFIVGVIFAPIGGVLLYQSDSVSEIVLDYTNCPQSSTFVQMAPSEFSLSFPGTSSAQISDSQKPRFRMENVSSAQNSTSGSGGSSPSSGTTPRCSVQFSVLQDMQPPVFLYYKLSNFYQNHRRYVRSVNTDQLEGVPVQPGASLENCSPLATAVDPRTNQVLPIYPCGLIANSVFNDTIQLSLNGVLAGSSDSSARPSNATTQYTMVDKNIAWPSDVAKFKQSGYSDPAKILPPPNWASKFPNGYSASTPPPNLQADEHFIVWMRTAGLPTFRKLYARNDQDVLKAGTYTVLVDNSEFYWSTGTNSSWRLWLCNARPLAGVVELLKCFNARTDYDVARFSGTKSLVLSTTSFIGGKNPFFGIIYIAAGIFCVVLGCAFTIAHLWRPRKLGDHTYLSWNQDGSAPPSGKGGTGTGVTE